MTTSSGIDFAASRDQRESRSAGDELRRRRSGLESADHRDRVAMDLVERRQRVEQRMQHLVERAIGQVGFILERGGTQHRATGLLGDLGCRIEQRGLSHARLAAEEQHRRRELRLAPHEGVDQVELGVPPEEHAPPTAPACPRPDSARLRGRVPLPQPHPPRAPVIRPSGVARSRRAPPRRSRRSSGRGPTAPTRPVSPRSAAPRPARQGFARRMRRPPAQ